MLHLDITNFDKAYPNPHCCSVLQEVELFLGHTRVELPGGAGILYTHCEI